MASVKVVVMGAGSASFGLNTVSALMASDALRGSHIALVDLDAAKVHLMERLAARLNGTWQSEMTITAHTEAQAALEGADFVISAVEVGPREGLWRQDIEIPERHGVRQPYGENGGPGGFAHAARNIGPVLEIVHAMERLCPDAWYISYSNPMVRICDAVSRHSTIKVAGLCHQIRMGYAMAGQVLADDLGLASEPGFVSTHADPRHNVHSLAMAHKAEQRLTLTAAGLNHFTWMLDLRDRETGEDLYPLFRERWAAYDPAFEPLTRRVFDAFGLFPTSGDEHLCEYLPWLANPVTRPWIKYDVDRYDLEGGASRRDNRRAQIARMADGVEPVDHLRDADSEGAREVVEEIACARLGYHNAVSLPNQGQISNLPAGAIVETPGLGGGAGVMPVTVGALPEGIAELCRREITVAHLGVDAAVTGDRQVALQCLLLDPVIDDLDVALAVLDDYLVAYREHLPQFWA